MDHLSITTEDSVAIVESQGFMAAARLVQLLSQESRARVVAVSPMNATGAITTVIAGPLAEVQYALQLAKTNNAISDSAFFARPQVETIEMLLRSAFGSSMSAPVQKKAKQPESLPLFEAPMEAPAYQAPAYQPVSYQPKPEQQTPRPVQRTVAPSNGSVSSSNGNMPSSNSSMHSSNGSAPSLNGSMALSNGRVRAESEENFEAKPYYELEAYPVHELRRYARSIPGFPIHGREISKANRSELLQLIKTTEERNRTQSAREAMNGSMVQTHEELTANITPN